MPRIIQLRGHLPGRLSSVLMEYQSPFPLGADTLQNLELP